MIKILKICDVMRVLRESWAVETPGGRKKAGHRKRVRPRGLGPRLRTLPFSGCPVSLKDPGVWTAVMS